MPRTIQRMPERGRSGARTAAASSFTRSARPGSSSARTAKSSKRTSNLLVELPVLPPTWIGRRRRGEFHLVNQDNRWIVTLGDKEANPGALALEAELAHEGGGHCAFDLVGQLAADPFHAVRQEFGPSSFSRRRASETALSFFGSIAAYRWTNAVAGVRPLHVQDLIGERCDKVAMNREARQEARGQHFPLVGGDRDPHAFRVPLHASGHDAQIGLGRSRVRKSCRYSA